MEQISRHQVRRAHQKARRYSVFQARNWSARIDLFQHNIPMFNMRGTYKVSTYSGAMLSFAIVIVLLLYGALKFIVLLSRSNPNVSTYTELNQFDSSDVLNLRDTNIRVAFGIEGYLDNELKNDPRYVKTIVRLWQKKDGVAGETILPFHKCTAEDFDHFAAPASDAVGMLEDMKTSDVRGLYCLDYDEIGHLLDLRSREDDDNYARLELVLLPCNYVHAEFGDVGDSISDECIADQTEQINYLGNMRSVVYFSDAAFKQNQYGAASVKRTSKFFTQQTDNFKPSWLFGQVVTNLLIDEAELIQYGQEDEKTFH